MGAPVTDFYTADTHFGHVNISGYCGRPYQSVDHMNADLLARINSVVRPGDWLNLLGDAALGQIHDSLALISRINCHVRLLPGNHDRCHPMNAHAADWRQVYLDAGFAEILLTTTGTRIGNHDVVLSHFPPRGDSHDDDRHLGWRPPADEPRPVIHGHVHRGWKVSGSQESGPWINVGVDAWNGYPVSEDTLAALLDAGPQHLPPQLWTPAMLPAVAG